MTPDDIGQMLRSHLTPQTFNDAESSEEIMRQVREIAANPGIDPEPTRVSAFRRYTVSYWKPAVVVLIVFMLVGIFTLPRDTWADFPLARYVGFDGVPESAPGQPVVIPGDQPDRVPTSVPPPPTLEGVELEFTPVNLESLPGDFQLVEELITGSDQLELQYERADEFALRLLETPADTSRNTIQREQFELINVGGIDVLMRYKESFNSVAHLIWEQDGVIFNLIVPTISDRWSLPPETARQIVEAIVSASDGR